MKKQHYPDGGNKSSQLRKAHGKAKRGRRTGNSTAMAPKNKKTSKMGTDYSDYPGYT